MTLTLIPFEVTFHSEWHPILSEILFWVIFHFDWHSIFSDITFGVIFHFERQSILSDNPFWVTVHFEWWDLRDLMIWGSVNFQSASETVSEWVSESRSSELEMLAHLKMWQATTDIWKWQVTCDTWHMTYDIWTMTQETLREVDIVSKFQVPISNGLGFMMFWRFGGKGLPIEIMNEWITKVFLEHRVRQLVTRTNMSAKVCISNRHILGFCGPWVCAMLALVRLFVDSKGGQEEVRLFPISWFWWTIPEFPVPIWLIPACTVLTLYSVPKNAMHGEGKYFWKNSEIKRTNITRIRVVIFVKSHLVLSGTLICPGPCRDLTCQQMSLTPTVRLSEVAATQNGGNKNMIGRY